MTDKAGTEGLEAELRLIHIRMVEQTAQFKKSIQVIAEANKLLDQHRALVKQANELLDQADRLKSEIDVLMKRANDINAAATAESEVDDARAKEIIEALELLGK